MEIFSKSQTDIESLGVYGAIVLLAGALALAITMNDVMLLVPLAYVVAMCLFFSREAFRDLKQLTKLVPVIIVASTLLWQEEYGRPSTWSAVTPYPFVTGFIVGVEMSVRAVVIVLAVSAFVRTVKISELSYLIEKVSRSKSFSFVFGLAFNISPYLERISRQTFNAIKLRGGFRLRNLTSSARYLLSSTTLNALAKCQDISYAAEARAFGSRRSVASSARTDPPAPSRIDLIVLIVTAIMIVLSFTSKA